MIIIYLSNRYIRVLSGDAAGERISVHKVYHAVDTAGCILNGTVTDEEGFLEIIKGIWESNNLPRTENRPGHRQQPVHFPCGGCAPSEAGADAGISEPRIRGCGQNLRPALWLFPHAGISRA